MSGTPSPVIRIFIVNLFFEIGDDLVSTGSGRRLELHAGISRYPVISEKRLKCRL